MTDRVAILSICFGVVSLVSIIYYVVIGFSFFILPAIDVEFMESFYFHSLLPIQELEIISSTASCKSGMVEMPIHTTDVSKGECDGDDGCETIYGVYADELYVWEDIKFCIKRLQFEEIDYSDCSKNCGKLCLSSSSQECPIEKVSLVSSGEVVDGVVVSQSLSSSDSENIEFLGFNETHKMKVSRVFDDDTSLFFNQIAVS